jgi:hypothetical protein
MVFWSVELFLLLIIAEAVSPLFLPPGSKFRYPQKLEVPSTRRIFTHQPNQRAYTVDKPFITKADLFLPWDHVHFSVRGHVAVAELLEEHLATRRLLGR